MRKHFEHQPSCLVYLGSGPGAPPALSPKPVRGLGLVLNPIGPRV